MFHYRLFYTKHIKYLGRVLLPRHKKIPLLCLYLSLRVGVLSEEQLRKYDEVVAAKLTPDCAAWLAGGAAGLEK